MLLWLKGEVFLRGLLPISPPQTTFSHENMIKIISYVRLKSTERDKPCITLSLWKYIAKEKLNLRLDYAETLFELFVEVLSSRTDETKQISDKTSVDVVGFVLFLFIQNGGRLRESVVSKATKDDVYPKKENVGATEPNRPHGSDKMDRNSWESYLLDFFKAEMLHILQILSSSDLSGDYHSSPQRVSDDVCLQKFAPLSLIFDCTLSHEHPSTTFNDPPLKKINVSDALRKIQPKGSTKLIHSEATKKRENSVGKWKSLKEVAGVLSSSLVKDPCFVVPCLPRLQPSVSSGGSGRERECEKEEKFIGLSSTDGLTVFLLSDIANSALTKNNESIEGSYVRIQNCRSAQLYLTQRFRAVVIENCRNCTIVLGPVTCVVRVQSCAHCRIITLCNQIMISDSKSSLFCIETEKRPLLLGLGNSKLTFSPYNTNYDNLEMSVQKADLNLHHNYWNSPVEILWSRSNDVNDSKAWSVLPPENFSKFIIPVDFGSGMVEGVYGNLPEEYRLSLVEKEGLLKRMQAKRDSLPPDLSAKLEMEMQKRFQEYLTKSKKLSHLTQLETADASQKRKEKKRP